MSLELTNSTGLRIAKSRLSSAIEVLAGTSYVVIGIFGVMLYSNYGTPIWLDEFLHFTLAGIDSTWVAIVKTQGTILNINHNQTGVYMLLDYWLLKMFGANATALRAPSLASAAWLLTSSATFFSARGYNNVWKLTLLLALVASGALMDYEGQARPYLPLAAAVVGVLAFYAASVRTGWITAVGYGSVVLGAVIHPYFPGYWIALAALGALLAIVESRLPLRLRALTTFIDLRLVFTGAALFVIVGALTWMRGGPDLKLNPFEFLQADRFLPTLIDCYNLSMFYNYGWPFQGDPSPQRWMVVGMALVACSAFLARGPTRASLMALLPPAALAVGSIVIAAILSWISYRHSYWILGRQWIASMALTPIAVVWFFAEAGRQADRRVPGLSHAFAVPLAYVAVVSLSNIAPAKLATIEASLRSPPERRMAGPPPTDVPPDANKWVDLANANIAQGGPVWPIFAQFYH